LARLTGGDQDVERGVRKLREHRVAKELEQEGGGLEPRRVSKRRDRRPADPVDVVARRDGLRAEELAKRFGVRELAERHERVSVGERASLQRKEGDAWVG